MSATSPPSADEQLAFLAKLQRVFAEGDFTSTYKFALLMALADLSVEHGQDDGSDLRLSIRQVAEQFIALYWHHSAPYGSGGDGTNSGVLIQNNGAQAAVLSALEDICDRTGTSTLTQALKNPQYNELVGKIATTVSAKPLKYMQNFGGTTQEFLYKRDGRGFICLKPGIPYCLRRFHPLVQQLSRTHWIDHIKSNKYNRSILGEGNNLEDFHFGTPRRSLVEIAQGLKKVDGNRCFYCQKTMNDKDVDVDHYIPFSLYGTDFTHNFVLTHASCNRSKSNTLAARPHLERWIERLTRHGDNLIEIGFTAGISTDIEAYFHVMHWAYGNAVAGGASVWLEQGKYQSVDNTYMGILLAQ